MSGFVHATADVRGDYRYSLIRVWDTSLPTVTFVLLNPSTADAVQLDPTLRRCIGFSRREGLRGMVIVNLYALRSKSPKIMRAAPDPVGPDNDEVLAAVTGLVIAGWGTIAAPERLTRARKLLPPLHALSVTQGGHPLYVPSSAPLVDWPPAP